MATRPVEFWTAGVGLPSSTVRQARQAEDEGWDGFGVVDSQNLAADPYVELALAAKETTRLKLGTAVTNPVTRHAAAAATAIATVHAESGGRAVLGIGRGDSSLAHIGLAPAPVDVFERYVERLRAYLRGEDAGFDQRDDVRPSSTLGMAGAPLDSRIHWIRGDLPPVPVDVAATGPKVIALGARLADRVTFAVGAEVKRLSWAIDVARRAREDERLREEPASRDAGLDADELDLGAYLPVLVHDDRAKARELISGGVASFARFSVMHGRAQGPLDDDTRKVLEAVHDAYDMNRHFSHGSPQSAPLTDEVIDAFGVAGPAAYCIERLSEVLELGIGRVFCMGGGFGMDREEARAARERLVSDVLPALR